MDKQAWSDRIDCPDIGPGWSRMSKSRPTDQCRQTDYIWLSPSGQRFRSLKQVQEHLSGVTSEPKGKKTAAPTPVTGKEAKKKAKPVTKSLKVAYRPPGHAAAAAAAAAAATPDADIPCEACGWGEDSFGNEILLCDTPECGRAYHLKCLPQPLAAIPAGDWFCPTCQPVDELEKCALWSPQAKRGLRRELQAVDGLDLMGWARVQAETPPEQPWRQGREKAISLAELPGLPCLYTQDRAAALRPGVVLDARYADPRTQSGALCVHLLLTGRNTPLWVALEQPAGVPPSRAHPPLIRARLRAPPSLVTSNCL